MNAAVKYRRVGHSDLSVSELSLGTCGIREGVSEESLKASLYSALDSGINLIDTSNSYTSGAAESFLGEVLKGVPRSSYLLATKLFFPVPPGTGGLSAREVRLNIDASLSRLRVDYVDLYQCHRYDESTPLEETMTALSELVRQGKVRYLGFSEWSPQQIEKALHHPELEPFASSQPQFSMLWRQPEGSVFPLCAPNGIGQLVWSPLAQGLLSGKYRPGQAPSPGTRASNKLMNQYLMSELYTDKNLRIVAQLVPIANGLGLTMSQLALAWVLRLSSVTSAILGVSSPCQVRHNVAASGVALPPLILDQIESITSADLSPTSTCT